MHTQFRSQDTLETMSGERKGSVSTRFTLRRSTARGWLRLPQLGPAYTKKRKIINFLKMLKEPRGIFNTKLLQRNTNMSPLYIH